MGRLAERARRTPRRFNGSGEADVRGCSQKSRCPTYVVLPDWNTQA
jgi:hypothetical protein